MMEQKPVSVAEQMTYSIGPETETGSIIMGQYAVLFDEKNLAFTLKDENEDKPNDKAFSHIYADKIGEMSEGTSHPMPAEHLKNLAINMGKDFSLFTVKNETTNERLDKLNQEAREVTDADKTVAVYTGEESKGKKGEDSRVLPAEVELRAPSEA